MNHKNFLNLYSEIYGKVNDFVASHFVIFGSSSHLPSNFVSSSSPPLHLFYPQRPNMHSRQPLLLSPRYLSDIREITLGNHRPGETQAWKQPGWPRTLKHGVPQATIKVRLARYLEIRPLGLIMAVRPHPDMVQLKYSA